MAVLDGIGRRVDLGRGVTLTAPGLRGDAELRQGPLGGRAGEPARTTDAFELALERAGMRQAHAVEITATQVQPPAGVEVRSADGSEGLELEVPDLGPLRGQVLLLTDEAGVLSWHFPQHLTPVGAPGAAGAPATPDATSRGAGSTVRFVVPRRVATAPPAGGAENRPGDRSLVTLIGKKILSVFVYPILDELVGKGALFLAERWEHDHRPTRLRTFDADTYAAPGGREPSGEDWRRLSGGRSLLFLHGTFSTSHGSFGGLPAATMTALSAAYGGRVLALDHPSLSVDPVANARELVARVGSAGPGAGLDVDIVAHSRGGLVARALLDQGGGPVRVGRTVFVGTPNGGTPLADPAHLGSCIDRVTALLNLVPPGPWTVVLDVLDAVLEVVKILGQGALGGLPGLASMDPRGRFLPRLGSVAPDGGRLFAVDADFEPTGSLAALWNLPETAVDKVFGDRHNDGVVPTDGVGTVRGPGGFTIDAERSLHFTDRDGVWHCSYFTEPRLSAALLDWLPGQGL